MKFEMFGEGTIRTFNITSGTVALANRMPPENFAKNISSKNLNRFFEFPTGPAVLDESKHVENCEGVSLLIAMSQYNVIE